MRQLIPSINGLGLGTTPLNTYKTNALGESFNSVGFLTKHFFSILKNHPSGRTSIKLKSKFTGRIMEQAGSDKIDVT